MEVKISDYSYIFDTYFGFRLMNLKNLCVVVGQLSKLCGISIPEGKYLQLVFFFTFIGLTD